MALNTLYQLSTNPLILGRTNNVNWCSLIITFVTQVDKGRRRLLMLHEAKAKL